MKLLLIIADGTCQRRIVRGSRTYVDKRYMVYLIKSYEDMDPHDSWLCGGALVTPTQILTSAACIIDIDNIYAIAGYRKYVNGLDIEKDNCTKVKKQRIVKIRVPREHIRHINDYQNSTRWMTLDIGVATVERPYDFEDVTYRLYCSYIPGIIEINYNSHLEDKIGTSVVALGWGRDKGSLPGEVNDRNSETLREVSLKIKSKDYCLEKFEGNGLTEMIKNYMICAYDKGLLDAGGFFIEELDKKMYNNCDNNVNFNNKDRRIMKMDTNECIEEKSKVLRSGQKTDIRQPMKAIKQSLRHIKKIAVPRNFRLHPKMTRRQGICQNDHGGPLITWVGSTELLIGVAVNSLYDENLECIGPYLFTSTSAAGRVIRCLLANEDPARRSCPENGSQFNITENMVRHNKAGIKPDSKNAQFRGHNKGPNKAHTKATVKAQTNMHVKIQSTADIKAKIVEYQTDAEVELPTARQVLQMSTKQANTQRQPVTIDRNTKAINAFTYENQNNDGLNIPDGSESLTSIEVVAI